MSLINYRLTDRAQAVRINVSNISYVVYALVDPDLFLIETVLASGTASSDASGFISIDLGPSVPVGTLVAFVFTKAASFGDLSRESFFGPLLTS